MSCYPEDSQYFGSDVPKIHQFPKFYNLYLWFVKFSDSMMLDTLLQAPLRILGHTRWISLRATRYLEPDDIGHYGTEYNAGVLGKADYMHSQETSVWNIFDKSSPLTEHLVNSLTANTLIAKFSLAHLCSPSFLEM
jgi:hypothetical protein